MKKVISVVCLLLSAVILTSTDAFAYPREHSEKKARVVVPSIQARFGSVAININSGHSRNLVWVPGHWQKLGRWRGYAWIPGHWEKCAQHRRNFGNKFQYRQR
ncbi:MAG: YXWGXW repeat-containing protein [Candidatus Omnitrophica bacterium]|nr:YXWGXW repeat-containing protein [Candidatus Omnitrophota bacterium]